MNRTPIEEDGVIASDVYYDYDPETGEDRPVEVTEARGWSREGVRVHLSVEGAKSYWAYEYFGHPSDGILFTCPNGHGVQRIRFNYYPGSRVDPPESWPVDEEEMFCSICHVEMEEY